MIPDEQPPFQTEVSLKEYLARMFRLTADALTRNAVKGGQDIVWDDFQVPASTVKLTGQTYDPGTEATSGLLLFDAGKTELFYALMQAPHKWKEGSEIVPHVHWQKTTSAAGDVTWRCRYKLAPIGEVMDADWTTLATVSTPVGSTPDTGTADKHLITSFGSMDTTGLTISDCILFEVARIGGDASDTYGADARLLEFDVHIQLNTLGSIAEFRKWR
jgi:hypothetical protein